MQSCLNYIPDRRVTARSSKGAWVGMGRINCELRMTDYELEDWCVFAMHFVHRAPDGAGGLMGCFLICWEKVADTLNLLGMEIVR